MPDDPIRDLIEGFRARLQAELDAQVRALTDQQAAMIDRARQSAEYEAEARWAAKIEDVRSEWAARLNQDVTAAREDAERAVAAESMRVRFEVEQQAAETSACLRREMEDALAAERRQAAEALEAERANGAHALTHAVAQVAAQLQAAVEERQRVEAALEAERASGAHAVTHAVAQVAAQLQAAVEERQRVEAALEAERASGAHAVTHAVAQVAAQLQAAAEERQRVEAALEAERASGAHAVTHAVAEAAAQLQAAVEERQRVEAELETERAGAAQAAADLDTAIRDRQREEQALDEERVKRDQMSVELQSARLAQQRAEAALADHRALLDARVRDLEQDRSNARAEADAERQRAVDARGALDAERQRFVGAAAERLPAQSLTGLIDGLRSIGACGSLSDALGAALRSASAAAPRAALFVVSGARLDEWPVAGLSSGSVTGQDAGLLEDVLRRHEPVWSDGNGSPAKAPAFAALPPGRAAGAAPVVVGGRTVAVLYADDGREGAAHGPWRDAIEILASHASACLAYLTAARTARAMYLLSAASTVGPTLHVSPSGDDDGARRYARLLLSEVKLYNEAAVRLGRQHHDLMTRLRPEIDRARRLYEERIPASIARDTCFRQEIVQTLADGDAALLG